MAAMNKHTDLEVIKNKAVALPALIKTIFADWKILRLLAEQADHLADEYDKYGRILDEFENYEPTDHETAPSGEYLKLNVNMKKTVARCGAWLDKIERDDLYDTDEHGDRVLKREVVSERLAYMLSTLVGEPSNPEVALPMLLQHIYAAELSYLALLSGCRDIEAGQKPWAHRNPGEFLKVFRAEEKRWRRRRDAICGLEDLAAYALTFIPKAQARFAQAQAKRKADAAARDLNSAAEWLRRRDCSVEAGQKAVDTANRELEIAIAEQTKAKQKFTNAVATKQAADAALAALEQQQQKKGEDE